MEALVSLANQVRAGDLTLQQFCWRMNECLATMSSNDLLALVLHLNDLDDDLDTDVIRCGVKGND
jgi:hypothetical protein